MSVNIGIVSLGCDKNTVDTEKLLGLLSQVGYNIVCDPDDADYIIVNTCAFIESAKVEAINTIIEMSGYKQSKCKKLFVIGCLANRYYNELQVDLSEADHIIKIGDYDKIIDIIGREEGDYNNNFSSRIISTPYHYAYLKVSEGCNNKCTYCAIPAIRGHYRSEKIETLRNEAKYLIDNYGIKELILVAQDVTRYGYDLYSEYSLLKLLDDLEKLDISWIRLMYCYPELVSDDLISRVSSSNKIAKYLDIPLQHISDNVLKRMNRRNNKKDTYNLLDRIRKIDDNISIRSTFIVGFPHESEEDYNELQDFIKHAELDNVGFFAYSREEGTPAYKMSNQIKKSIKQQRLDSLYALQTETLIGKYSRMVGSTINVMYEGIDYDNQCFYGRGERSAPKIDSKVLFTGSESPEPGDIIKVEITGNKELDLTGIIVK